MKSIIMLFLINKVRLLYVNEIQLLGKVRWHIDWRHSTFWKGSLIAPVLF